MNIGITGHTKGLGKAFLEQAKKKEWMVSGFSRSNGFDIGIREHRKSIIEQSEAIDVFINNAYDGYAQIDFLYEMYNVWKNKKMLVISVSSMASNAAEWRKRPCKYSVIKNALDVASFQLNNSEDKSKNFRLTLFKPGYLNTESNRDHQLKTWIDTQRAASMLIELISISPGLHVPELTLSPWKKDDGMC